MRAGLAAVAGSRHEVTRRDPDRRPVAGTMRQADEPERDFSAESTTRGGGCPDGPSKQAFEQKIDEILSK